MGKRISELPAVTALGDSDVLIANHIDTSEQEPVTATSRITVSNLKQTLGINGKVDASDIGAAGGVAELDGNGKIPSAQLPGFVDDVVEAYYDVNTDRFYEESTFTTLIPPVSDKSWVDIAANKSYRWTGSVYVRVDEGVQLGETSGSAYRGDRGKTAYDFSQNPATATPSMDGTGAAGSSGKWAREDHVHPKDTTKADKVASATNGNFAGLDGNGNLTDSGKKPSDFLTSHQDISGKADKVSGATAGDVATLDANGNPVDSGKILEVSVPSTAVFTDMAGADANYNGSHGYVPAPSAGDQDKVLSGAGIWVPQSSGGSGKADITAIGTEEAGATASKAYSTGDRFYKNGKFCTAIASIAQGATFTLNTNYVEGTIADAIKDLNSQLVNCKDDYLEFRTSLIPELTSNTSATGITVSASSEADAYKAYSAFNNNIYYYGTATDSDAGSRWNGVNSQSASIQWIKVVFNQAKRVFRLWLVPFYLDFSNHLLLHDYKFQASNDGSTWIDVYSGSFEDKPTEAMIDVYTSIAYTQYRIKVESSYDGNRVSISRIQLYGYQ